MARCDRYCGCSDGKYCYGTVNSNYYVYGTRRCNNLDRTTIIVNLVDSRSLISNSNSPTGRKKSKSICSKSSTSNTNSSTCGCGTN